MDNQNTDQEEENKQQNNNEHYSSINNNENKKSVLGKGVIFGALLIIIIVILGMRGTVPWFSKSKGTSSKKESLSLGGTNNSSTSPQGLVNNDLNNIASSVSSNLSRSDIENLIKNYISQNPEIIIEALQSYEKKVFKEKMKQSNDFISSNMQQIIKDRPVIGNPNGNKIIVKFFDYQCGYCKSNHLVLQKIISEDQDVRVVLENLPVLGEASALASKASVAVWKINPKIFKAFHDDLIQSSQITQSTIEMIAKKYNINKSNLIKEMNSDETQKLINNNMQVAQHLGIQGVPAFIIDNQFIPGSIDYNDIKRRLSEIKSVNSNVKSGIKDNDIDKGAKDALENVKDKSSQALSN